jgi:hypothetical protein
LRTPAWVIGDVIAAPGPPMCRRCHLPVVA